MEALGAWVRKRVQKRDEHVLTAPFMKTSWTGKSPTFTRFWNAHALICRAKAPSVKWC